MHPYKFFWNCCFKLLFIYKNLILVIIMLTWLLHLQNKWFTMMLQLILNILSIKKLYFQMQATSRAATETGEIPRCPADPRVPCRPRPHQANRQLPLVTTEHPLPEVVSMETCPLRLPLPSNFWLDVEKIIRTFSWNLKICFMKFCKFYVKF